MKEISVRLCGNPEIVCDGKTVTFPYRKAEGFFYYLCVRKSVTREEVISLLWGDEDETNGKKKLRDAVYQVKRAIDPDILITAGHTGISLNPEFTIRTDLDSDSRGKGEDLFLNHFFIKNCYEFETWVDEMRETLSSKVSDSARKGLEEAAAEHDTVKMQKYSDILIKNDPYDENLYYELMNIYAANGSYNMAIRIYYDLVRMLKKEMEVEPAQKTQDLFHRIFNMKEHVASGTGRVTAEFFGRERELFEISGMMDSEDGSPMNVAVIEGEEGVGKSTFLEYCRKMAEGKRMLPLSALCYRQGADFFLSPWNDIMQEISQQMDKTDRGDSDNYDILREMELNGESSGKIQYAVAEKKVLELFRKLSEEQQIFLTFDEIQWMDEASYRLLVRLVCAISPDRLKVICTYDGNYESEVMQQLEELVRQDRVRFMTLERFTEAETERIIRNALPSLANEPEKRQEIWKLTEGNAFFLTEMIDIISRKGFTLEKTPKINVVIKSRLSSITEDEREVLECMSVFPEKIKIDELELLLAGRDRLSIIRMLDHLQREHLISEMLVGWNVYYKFVHRIIKEYIYEHQSAGKTQAYHKILAGYYVKQRGENFAMMPIIAYHYRMCHDEVKAYEYQIRYLQEFYTVVNENFPIVQNEASEMGDTIGSMAEAEKMLKLAENVIRLPLDTPEVNRIRMKMNYILGRHDIALGEYDSGIANIEACTMLANRLGDRSMILACYKQQIFHGIQIGDIDKADQYVSKGLSMIGQEETDEYATFLRLQGWTRLMKQDYSVASEVLTKSLNIFKALEKRQEPKNRGRYSASIAACYNYLGEICREQGNYYDALRYYNEAVQMGQGPVKTNGMAQVYSGIGQVKYDQGKYTEGYIYLDRAREDLEHNGYRWGLERTEAYLAMTCIKLGKTDEARIHYEKGRQIAAKIRNPLTAEILAEVERHLNEAG